VIMEEDSVKEILNQHNFQVNLNTRFQLIIKNLPK
jgi:hypothetical protein